MIELFTIAHYTNSFMALSHACGHKYAACRAPILTYDFAIDLSDLRRLLALHELV